MHELAHGVNIMFLVVRFLLIAIAVVAAGYALHRAYKARPKLTRNVALVVLLVAVLAWLIPFLAYHTDTFTIM